jgi:hypothetical protein
MSANKETSLFQPYSIGVVANDKDLNSDYIEVLPVEPLSMVSGEITDNVDTLSVRGIDSQGKEYQSSVNLTVTIKAKWIPYGNGNRMTSPDVRRGEKVQIYRLANSEQYFWDTLENNSTTRRLETVVYGYCATKKENEPMNQDNTYTQGVSTHQGFVNLINTTKQNGEKFAYSIYVDAKNGVVKIKDDVGNEIFMDSGNCQVQMKNAAGSFLDMTKAVGTWVCSEAINVKTTNWNLTTQTMHNKGELLQQGNQIHEGNLEIKGGLTGSAGGGSDGSAVFNGGIRTTKDIKAGNISLMHHHHHADVAVNDPY